MLTVAIAGVFNIPSANKFFIRDLLLSPEHFQAMLVPQKKDKNLNVLITCLNRLLKYKFKLSL